jgi:hypothetical protein
MEPSALRCYISNVSNDILDLIFSFIRMDVVSWDGKDVSPIMVLMHVSRQFRSAILQWNYWLGFKFDFRMLVCPSDRSEHSMRDPEHPHPVNALIKTLFADDACVQSLKRKTDWAFPPSCPELMSNLFGRIPDFPRTLRKLWLCGQFQFTLDRLPSCPNVEELGVLDDLPLKLPPPTNRIDLSRIVETFPNIQHLYLAIPLTSIGSISSLSNLSSFEILVVNEYDEELLDTLHPRFLPLGSTSTLTTLRISGYGYSIDPEFTLAPFTALQHFKFTEGFGRFDDVLRTVPTKLVSFEAQIYTDDDNDYYVPRGKPSFAHSCLTNLCSVVIEAVCMNKETDVYFLDHMDRCMDILDELADALPEVHNVRLEHAALDVSRLGSLSRFRNLHSLTWILGKHYHCMEMGSPNGEFSNRERAVGVISEIFRDWTTKPMVRVLMHRELLGVPFRFAPKWPLHSAWYDYGGISRWPLNIDALPENRELGW